MTFREAMLVTALAQGDKKTHKKLSGLSEEDHPVLWAALQRAVARKYYRSKKVQITEGFDWSTILDWLRDNWVSIVAKILMILITLL
jgi:hypothetical protein